MQILANGIPMRTTYPLQRCGNFRFCTYDIDAIGLYDKDPQGNG